MKGGQLRACIIFGRAQLKHREGELKRAAPVLHQKKNHPWRKSGTRDAANDMPGALSGREHHQDGSVLLHQHKQLVAKHQQQEQSGDETLTGSEMHGVFFKDCSAPEGQKSL